MSIVRSICLPLGMGITSASSSNLLPIGSDVAGIVIVAIRRLPNQTSDAAKARANRAITPSVRV